MKIQVVVSVQFCFEHEGQLMFGKCGSARSRENNCAISGGLLHFVDSENEDMLRPSNAQKREQKKNTVKR